MPIFFKPNYNFFWPLGSIFLMGCLTHAMQNPIIQQLNSVTQAIDVLKESIANSSDVSWVEYIPKLQELINKIKSNQFKLDDWNPTRTYLVEILSEPSIKEKSNVDSFESLSNAVQELIGLVVIKVKNDLQAPISGLAKGEIWDNFNLIRKAVFLNKTEITLEDFKESLRSLANQYAGTDIGSQRPLIFSEDQIIADLSKLVEASTSVSAFLYQHVASITDNATKISKWTPLKEALLAVFQNEYKWAEKNKSTKPQQTLKAINRDIKSLQMLQKNDKTRDDQFDEWLQRYLKLVNQKK